MGKHKQQVSRSQRVVKGRGAVNTLINKLPFELHLPGYNFLGPGTKLQKRLERGDKGINLLDEAAKDHDIAYRDTKSLAGRHKADEVLEHKAWERVKAKDAKLGEKAAAWLVTNVMKAKRKLGMGLPKTGRALGERKVTKRPKKRVIQTPKLGGFLPLLFPALAALGALAGGGSAIASAVNKAKADKQQLEEQKRHNLAMETKGKGLKKRKGKRTKRKGKGLYLRPYRGYGSKNSR